jgi:hypothetical protein
MSGNTMTPLVAIATALWILASVLPGNAQPAQRQAPSYARIGLLTFNTPEASVPFRTPVLYQ